jgi:hypothetical protein
MTQNTESPDTPEGFIAMKQLVLPWGLSDTEGEEVTSLVMREGRITARLQHPHVIAVHDVVQHNGHPCLIMESAVSP